MGARWEGKEKKQNGNLRALWGTNLVIELHTSSIQNSRRRDFIEEQKTRQQLVKSTDKPALDPQVLILSHVWCCT